ncbi:signal transduction histidine kinase [Salsuginibacillus halophilus]|uniref:histidine kinase n=1 Tax=Salsuginibacillus halophilus TaxID=517424 RepID=A0A2P8H9T4_9BACI|nr:ATP-binding protein [Salsuginibacillus halophilus]PSL42974.1 signal transduction histidine kinase [Salsuginibacillus halophilus]
MYSLKNIDSRYQLEEHVAVLSYVEEAEEALSNPELYEYETDSNQSIELPAGVSATLYTPDGLVTFTSDENGGIGFHRSLDIVYQDLYELRRLSDRYMYKQPVFAGSTEIVGIYELSIPREIWNEEVEVRQMYAVMLFASILIMLYAGLLWAVQRKLITPLTDLTIQMTNYAKGERSGSIETHRSDEFGRLYQHFEQMKTDIDQARAELASEQQKKEQMMASLSHDLKTPLTAIRTYSEAMPENKYAQTIQRKAEEMQVLIDDLHAFSMLERVSESFLWAEVDIEELFEMILSDYEVWGSSFDLSYTVKILAEGSIKVDVKQMQRAVNNLMSNAVRFAESHVFAVVVEDENRLPASLFPEAVDAVRSQQRGGGMQMIIQNDGVVAADNDRLFEPFYQGEKEQFSTHSGLGLSIVKKIAEAHGGDIILIPCPGQGTVASLWIPKL